MERHDRDAYYIVGEGVFSSDGEPGSPRRPATSEEVRLFRFSRLLPEGSPIGTALLRKLATAMTPQRGDDADDKQDSDIPAGYTYLGQKIAHDLTLDMTQTSFGANVTVDQLLQGRSPALDLDSMYGLGPSHPDSSQFYEADRTRLLMGRTTAAGRIPALEGYDLPRRPTAPNEPGSARIPDHRNDENLAVAQIHLAFIRFHNRVVRELSQGGTPSVALFEQARELVVKHYQWMLHTDYLPRIADPEVVEEVFRDGRRFFEVPSPDGDDGALPGDTPTVPVEFSIAAFRLGHSMAGAQYDWNGIFPAATLDDLFRFSGTSGGLTEINPLPSTWIADFRRLFDLVHDGGAAEAFAPPNGLNVAKRIDSLLTRPLRTLPQGSFTADPGQAVPPIQRNLAYRNLVRARMVKMATGGQAADHMSIPRLSYDEIIHGDRGADLSRLSPAEREELVANTPLWFYILREAELNNGCLKGVGARIVAEVFHRAMECSRYSIVRDPTWRPTYGPDSETFRMPHLLLYAFDGDAAKLSPVA